MAGAVQEVTQPTSILSIVGGITFLAIVYALVTNATGVASIVTSLGNGYSSALGAAKGR
jgi:hypothetical protein